LTDRRRVGCKREEKSDVLTTLGLVLVVDAMAEGSGMRVSRLSSADRAAAMRVSEANGLFMLFDASKMRTRFCGVPMAANEVKSPRAIAVNRRDLIFILRTSLSIDPTSGRILADRWRANL
jgi:hypothetical protein